MKNEKKSLLGRIVEEYKKVTWANKATVFQVTIIVLLITAFVATMIILFDISFKYMIDSLSTLLGKVLK